MSEFLTYEHLFIEFENIDIFLRNNQLFSLLKFQKILIGLYFRNYIRMRIFSIAMIS